MNIFLSYRFTGEDPKELDETLGKIASVLRSRGHEVYCSIEDEEWFREAKRTNGDIMRHAFSNLDSSDIFLAFIRREEKSEGMLVEAGYAFGKDKRVALALKRGIKTTSLHEMADPVIEFDEIEDLCEKLEAVSF